MNCNSPPALWPLRIFALAALVGSGFLLYESIMHGPALPGCSPGSGCDAVLGSRWGYWLGAVPVAAPAVGLYALLLAMSWQVGPDRPPQQRALAGTIMAAAALVAAGAAAWFIVLQVAVIGDICIYCTSTHAMGLAAAILAGVVLWPSRHAAHANREEHEGNSEPRPNVFTRKHAAASALLATGVLTALVAGQLAYAPPTMRIEAGQGITGDSGPGPNRELFIASDERGVRLTPHDQPTLGSPDAETLIVFLYDYTCVHCRVMHRQLETIRNEAGDQLGIVMLPVPLDACHPLFEDTPPAHAGACELAKLALAVWQADATQFEAFDQWLTATDQTRPVNEAHRHAADLVGQGPLTTALADPWVQQQPTRNATVHLLSDAAPLPQLMGPHLWIRGRPETVDDLRHDLKNHLPLTTPSP